MARRSLPQRVTDFSPWLRTIGAMQAEGEEIKAWCHGGCDKSRMVDLDRLIAAKGVDYSLINRRCRCTLTPGCKGWVRFHYFGHGGLRDLVTEPQTMLWIERDRYAREIADQGRQMLAKVLREYPAEQDAKRQRDRR